MIKNRRTNKSESRKLTLEERISRLERALAPTRKSRKFERSNDPGIFIADEARRFKSILNKRNDIQVVECSADPNVEDWYVVIADDEGYNETSFNIYKYTDGHVEAWRDNRSRYGMSFDDVEECADRIMPYDDSLEGGWY